MEDVEVGKGKARWAFTRVYPSPPRKMPFSDVHGEVGGHGGEVPGSLVARMTYSRPLGVCWRALASTLLAKRAPGRWIGSTRKTSGLKSRKGRRKREKRGEGGGDKRRRPGKAGLKKDIRCDDVQEKSGQTKVKRIEAGEKKEKRGGGRDLLLCVVSVLQGKLQEGAAC